MPKPSSKNQKKSAPFARKRFGQNFLSDQNIISNIIGAINPQSGEHLLEIGPGRGALTDPLLTLINPLLAIEVDRDLAANLRTRYPSAEQLVLIEADALKCDLTHLAREHHIPDHTLRVIGNLPYNISTPLLFHLMNHREIIQDMHFMLQKEVIERMAAVPGEKEYGRLSLMIQYHCNVTPLFDVPPSAFRPQPKVTSAIVRLTPHSQPPVTANNHKWLSTIVTQAFSQRRKVLGNSLKQYVTDEQFEAAGVEKNRRAETLSLQEFVGLANESEAPTSET